MSVMAQTSAVDLVEQRGLSHSTTENEKKEAEIQITGAASDSENSSEHSGDSETNAKAKGDVPLSYKLMSVLLVSMIGFGSHWSSGVTGAMKSTIKKQMHVNNTQFALLEASENFMVTALMLVSGLVTDRIGGAGRKRNFDRLSRKIDIRAQVPSSTVTPSTPSAPSSSQRPPPCAPTNSCLVAE